MKTNIFKLMAAVTVCAAAVVMASCKEKEVVTPDKPGLLVIGDTIHTFVAENADTYEVTIDSVNTTWSVKVNNSNDTAWLKANKEGEKVKITVTNNDTEEERTGKVIIECVKEPTLSKTIIIIQEGLIINLNVPDFKDAFAPDANGETSAKELKISSNHPWTIEDIPEWLAFDETEGSEGKTVKVWPTSFNVASTDREAIVKVKSGSIEKEIRIAQEHLIFDISDTELMFDFFCAGQKYAQEIIITCNASLLETFYNKPNWLGTEGLKVVNEERIIKVWPNSINSTASERSVVLTVKAAGVEKNVKIVQTNNVPWSFCPDITLGLDRTSDEILAIFGDDGVVLDGNIGYISYNENIMGLVFSLDSNNVCDNAMSQFRSSVSNSQVINYCNSHYDTDVMVDLALMMYNQPSWKGWAKHNNKGDITALIIYDTEKNILTAAPFSFDSKQSVKRQEAPKEIDKVILRTFTKMAEGLQKQEGR